MRFKKVTSSKYVGESGLSLIQGADGSFSIFKNRASTIWGTGFQSVIAAENFINSHSIDLLTNDFCPISYSDLEFMLEAYNLIPIGTNRYKLEDGSILKIIQTEDDVFTVEIDSKLHGHKIFSDPNPLFVHLDNICDNNIFARVVYRGVSFRSIFAKRQKKPSGKKKNTGQKANNSKKSPAPSQPKQKSYNRARGPRPERGEDDNKTTREIAQNLVRVKSSNVWAYGVEIKDRKDNKGDVYVQFKGKNGGPADIYKYYDVPLNVWRKLLAAPSKGHATWRYLRNNFYYSKLTGNKRGVLPNAIN